MIGYFKNVIYCAQDLRRRKIWDFFEKSGTDLRVQTFVPKPEALVADYDWVIGNHSDELTPWYFYSLFISWQN